MPNWTGPSMELLWVYEDAEVVADVLAVVLWVCEDEVAASGIHSPTTQYGLPTSRLGQETPG